ncbi:glycosyltransferase family 4 [Pyrrhoderma noxium]|uniref:Glycosyltransferase family 4 n=1 Tax=Pyrrhoderma noxium TaxID=2282107 RepID=A0A286UHZ7_9AGAM|nr:glycosyltransferase family 4 [Pyrrhoderma noxium]
MANLAIAMISDFFFPNVGGVENHIYMLAAELLRRGHKVIIITHSHPPDRVGIRWLSPGLKVIVLRERINIVHAHASLSSLGHEGILHAHHMGLRTVFTDHSLFGFEDAASILTNKLLEATMANVDGVICVSHTGRENTVLRSCVHPSITHVIPNALIVDQFKPAAQPLSTEKINIVVVSRLAYRKGIDLLVATAPRICALFPNVHFIIGGDGPKLIDILQMREKHLLQDRIELRGSVKHEDVRSVLAEGSIFLNTSLTEAFGIAIVEAACAGLYVVSTRVGGVPEVLPEDMISFALPEEDDVVRAMSEAIVRISKGLHDPLAAHERIRSFYNWKDVTKRTEQVYDFVLAAEEKSLWTRIKRTYNLGRFAGPIYVVILIMDIFFFNLLEWFIPREDIDYVPEGYDWKQTQFQNYADLQQT